jgi:hypothetical protein
MMPEGATGFEQVQHLGRCQTERDAVFPGLEFGCPSGKDDQAEIADIVSQHTARGQMAADASDSRPLGDDNDNLAAPRRDRRQIRPVPESRAAGDDKNKKQERKKKRTHRRDKKRKREHLELQRKGKDTVRQPAKESLSPSPAAADLLFLFFDSLLLFAVTAEF